MATQLTAIHTEILETAGLASDDPRFPSATLTRIVNRALRNVSAIHDWPWNQATEDFTLAANTVGYTPAAAWSKTFRLRYDNRDLFRFQPRDAQRFVNITGDPVGYYIEQEKVNFVPTPDGVYTVEHVYYAYETALSGDTDTPALPDRYIDWLVWEACKIVASRIDNTDLFAVAERQSKEWARRAHDEVLRSKASIKVQTRSDWSI